MKYSNWILVGVMAISFFACAQQEQQTDSGITYTIVKQGSGTTPDIGGFWGINIAYFDHTGKKLFSSEDRGGTIETAYMAPYPANGGLEECFNYVGEGDSAVFQVPADSLYKYTAGRMAPEELVGTMMEVQIGVDAVYTRDEYLAKMEEANKARVEEELATIEAYIAENNIDAYATEEGVFVEIIEPGTGEKAQAGQQVKVAYKGYVLDGTVFDTSIEEEAKAAGVYNPGRAYEPYGFTMVTGSVIQGWHIGVGELAEGGKAKLIIPSRYAYGPQARGPVIKANSILVFDVELVEIVDDENN